MSRTTKSLVTACFCLTGMLLPQVAAAGTFSSATITGVSSLQAGPFVIASDLNGATGSTVISGVGTFTQNAGGYFNGSNFSGGAAVSLGDADLNSLLQTQRFNASLSTSTGTGGAIPVTIGRHYVLELYSYNPNVGSRTMDITAEGDPAFTFSLAAGAKRKVSYDFIAGDTGLNVTVNNGTGDSNVTISGFSLLDITTVPEPGSLSLLSLGIVGVMRVARRRHYRSQYGRL